MNALCTVIYIDAKIISHIINAYNIWHTGCDDSVIDSVIGLHWNAGLYWI